MTPPADRVREALGSSLPVIEVYAEPAAGTDGLRSARAARLRGFAVPARVRVRERGDPVRYGAVPGTAGELPAAWLPPGDEEAAGRARQARERRAREAALTAR
ncbi:hypothetical protein [Streptomyces sp. 147326]|uniref:hypothetical protein n=1 Tax=Streptomyces sp. 147326 TaxID=3074379 RepID=UPI003857BE71